MTLVVDLDDQVFLLQRRGGISRCFVELLQAFDDLDDVTLQTPFRWVVNDHLLAARPGFRRLPGPRRTALPLGHALNRRGDASVVHHTYYDRRYLVPGQRRVTTVHDMIPDRLGTPEVHLAKRAFVEASDVVVCVSETTRRDLEELWGPPRQPVVVVPHGVGERFFVTAAPQDYVLYVGERAGYKDFATLLEALQHLPGLRVVAVGGGPLTGPELALGNRVEQRSVSDADLPGVYAGALAVVSTSRREGFGLPVLEAMAAGPPLVLSDLPVYREIAGDTAHWFAPGDAGQLAHVLAAAVDAPRGSGTARARERAWGTAARSMRDAYLLAQGRQ